MTINEIELYDEDLVDDVLSHLCTKDEEIIRKVISDLCGKITSKDQYLNALIYRIRTAKRELENALEV
jgi:hypothetical protein|nr:MAG TPA: hypothetical protein [Caudoviricetes sp.]